MQAAITICTEVVDASMAVKIVFEILKKAGLTLTLTKKKKPGYKTISNANALIQIYSRQRRLPCSVLHDIREPGRCSEGLRGGLES